MKMKITPLTAGFAIILCATLSAQAPRESDLAIGRVADVWITRTEQLVVPAAEAMPEELYPFAPTAGEFTGVRTFAEQVKHLAAANHQLASLILGEHPPAGTANETAPVSVQTKAQVLAYLRGSFASLHRAAARLTRQNLEDVIVVGRDTQTGIGVIIDAVAHSQNHYGQMVEYLRMNRIVPPASRQ